LLAWRQQDLQRLLACSSISHAGFLVLGAGVWVSLPQGDARFEAARALLFYLAAYVFMSNGAFAFVKASGTSSRADLRGYAASKPALAAALSVILLSLAGIPPLAGFFAKFLIFWEALEAGAFGPLVMAAVATLVALGYYLGLVRDMYFEPAPTVLLAAIAPPSWRVLWTCALASIVLGILPWLLSGPGSGGGS
ncbi:MAG: proton-conducting transporter membrane subunit, partial [Vicinamibacteria bacterium]